MARHCVCLNSGIGSMPLSWVGMEGISYEYRNAAHDGSHAYLFPVVNKLLENVPANATVLDLGCGNGSFLSLFAGRGWKCYGTDFSPTGIAVARENFPATEFFLADASAPTKAIAEAIGEGGADAVISTEVIEHLYDPRGFLRNANSLLKPGGMLVLSTPYHGYLKNLMLAVTGKLDQHFTALWDHGHIKFWSKKTLTAVLHETGFDGIQFVGAGRLPWLWKSIVVRARKS